MPNPELLIKLLQGLIQSFPELTAEQLMYEYIESIPGIAGKLSDEEKNDIIDKSVNGVTIWSDVPHTQLLTP